MAYSIVASVSAGGSGTTTSSAIDTTGADQIFFITSGNAAGTVSDSKGNTYTQDAASSVNCTLFSCHAPTVGSGHTFTVNDGGNFDSFHVLAVSGSTTTPLDKTNAAASSSAGAITPSVNNEIVIAGCRTTSTGTLAIDSGFTIATSEPFTGGQFFGGAIAYLIQTTATAENPAWSGPTVADAVIASYKAAAGGGGGGATTSYLSLLGVG